LLWLVLLGLAAVRLARSREPRPPLLLPLAAWVLFNAALHLFYGEDLFLYTEQWTFAVVALVALSLGSLRGLPFAVAGLVGAQLLANVGLLADLFRIYG
jgi:hypothetical protein